MNTLSCPLYAIFPLFLKTGFKPITFRSFEIVPWPTRVVSAPLSLQNLSFLANLRTDFYFHFFFKTSRVNLFLYSCSLKYIHAIHTVFQSDFKALNLQF